MIEYHAPEPGPRGLVEHPRDLAMVRTGLVPRERPLAT